MAAELSVQKCSAAFVLTVIVSIVISLALVPQAAAARSTVLDMQSFFGSQRRLLDSIPAKTTPNTTNLKMAIEMIPPHHVNSPFYRPNLTRAERVAASAEQTRTRAMRMRRRLTTDTGPFTSPGLYYQSQGGEYIMQIMIGTPASSFQVIADTGSDLCWVQCLGCNPCSPQGGSPFDPTTSSTYSPVSCSDPQCTGLDVTCSSQSSSDSCNYKYTYGTSGHHTETDGTLSLDTLALYDSSGQAADADTSFYFGCGLSEMGTFSKVDGLFGLGQGPLSLIQQLGEAIDNKFSYCLVDHTVNSLTSTLLLGGDGDLSLIYINLFPNPSNSPSYYYVDLQTISVGEVDVSIPEGTFDISSGGVILDSGTTFTFLDEAAFDPLATELEYQISYQQIDTQTAQSTYGLALCYDTSSVDTVSFPDVAFTFPGLVITPDANRNIFTAVEDDGSAYCLAFIRGVQGGVNILGNVWQQNYQIAYELDNQRVGFASTTCGS